jgi:hypothetical protein
LPADQKFCERPLNQLYEYLIDTTKSPIACGFLGVDRSPSRVLNEPKDFLHSELTHRDFFNPIMNKLLSQMGSQNMEINLDIKSDLAMYEMVTKTDLLGEPAADRRRFWIKALLLGCS